MTLSVSDVWWRTVMAGMAFDAEDVTDTIYLYGDFGSAISDSYFLSIARISLLSPTCIPFSVLTESMVVEVLGMKFAYE